MTNQPVAFTLDAPVRPWSHATAGVREEHYFGLAPLGLVEVHQPDRVGSAGLERDGLNLARLLRIVLQRVSRIGQRALLLNHLAHAIDGVKEIAGIYHRPRKETGRFPDWPAFGVLVRTLC